MSVSPPDVSPFLVSGPPITITGGHLWWCNAEADGVDGVPRRARQLLKDGVDFLKIMASGGGTQGINQAASSYTGDEIATAMHEAHMLGQLTIAHCLAGDSVAKFGLAAGVSHSHGTP